MNDSFNIEAPEYQSLRDYLHAVEEIMLTTGQSIDDCEQVKDEICSQVCELLGESPHQTDEINRIVLKLDAPESYRADRDSHVEPSLVKTPLWIKQKGVITVCIVLVLLLLGIFVGYRVIVGYQNEFVVAEKAVDQSVAQVDVVLQRRHDLIPNLVEIVRGYAKHEAETLENVIRMRRQWSEADSPQQKQAILLKLEPQLYKIMAIAEQYPNLKASENFSQLQSQLESTENRISVERRRMNLAIQNYNTRISMFPGKLVAVLLGYKPNEMYYESMAEAAESPKVTF